MQFLRNGNEIQTKVNELISQNGNEPVLMAVAYWGQGSEVLCNQPHRIICDLESGACNPSVIRKIWEASPHDIRMRSDFHAKVVIGSTGAVVSSANMSINGLGLREGKSAGNHEAGYFVEDSNQQHKEIIKWFETHWSLAQEISDTALAAAQKKWIGRQAQAEPRLHLPKLVTNALLQQNFHGDSVLRSVIEPLHQACSKVLLDVTPTFVTPQIAGKIASAAVHLMLNVTDQTQTYRRSSDANAPSEPLATDDWIAGHVRKMDKANGERLVSILLHAFANGDIAVANPKELVAVQSAAKQALAKLPW